LNTLIGDKGDRWLFARIVPAGSVMLGSLTAIIPVIADHAFLPPFGLLMLLTWRLLSPGALPVWAPLPLGLFDDMVSGQPTGTAMLLWTVSSLGIDLIDQRMVWRDFWQDWLVASGSIGLFLMLGRLIAAPLEAHVDTALVVQLGASILLYPAAARLCAWLGVRTQR